MEYLRPNNTDAFVTLQDINLYYGQFRALKNVNIDIERAEMHAIVGEHGAGKSSVGMVISGSSKPQSQYSWSKSKEG